MKRSVNIKPPLFFGCALAIVCVSLALFTASCTENKIEITLTQAAPQPVMDVAELNDGEQFEPKMLGIVPGAAVSELGFNWYGGAGAARAWVRLFRGGSFVSVTSGRSGRVPAKTGGTMCGDPLVNCDHPEMSWHKVTVSGLASGTAYEYSVSNDSINWSYRKTFTTPGTGGFTFAAVADPQLIRGDQNPSYFGMPAPIGNGSVADGWRLTMEKITARGVDLIVSGGDQVDWIGGSGSFSMSNADEVEYELFFAPPGMQSIPFAPVVGNHDLHNQFSYHFNLPNTGTRMDTSFNVMRAGANSYYYLFGSVLFVALNTGIHLSSVSAAETQVAAMNTLLSTAKSAHSGRYNWLIVHHHRSPHSQSAHSAEPLLGYLVKAGLNELMEEHGVDIVITGHDHSYSRSHVVTTADVNGTGVIDRDATSSDNRNITLNKGTVFFGLPSASGVKYYPLYYKYYDNTEYPYLSSGHIGNMGTGSAAFNTNNPTWAANVRVQSNTPGYSIFEVSGNIIRVRVFRTHDDGVIDDVTITKPASTSILQFKR